jgi:thiol-disulfide isomerase/thioredoxin
MKKLNLVNFLIIFVVAAGIFTVAKHFYQKPNVNDGEKAPDFTAVSHKNLGFKLSDLKGKYVLLDFWGSWCGPCFAEAPALISLYEKYGNAHFKDAEGFTIVSVAVDKDKQRWVNAIEQLGLTWPYQAIDPVSSYRFFDSPIAKYYGVKQLPTKFLLDGDRKIIGVDMPMGEIERFLAERMVK